MAIRFQIRSYLRFPVECPVYFLGPDFLGKGTIVNLSKAGSQIVGDQSVQRGTPIALRVFLPDQEAPVRIARARVRWSAGREFGLQNLTLHPDEQTRLARYIRHLACKPACWVS